MNTIIRSCLTLMSFSLLACGTVENWVQSASQTPAQPGNTSPEVPDTPQIPAAPGYAFSSAGETISSPSYKLRFRFGKTEDKGIMTGSTQTIRTGKTRHLKDM